MKNVRTAYQICACCYEKNYVQAELALQRNAFSEIVCTYG